MKTHDYKIRRQSVFSSFGCIWAFVGRRMFEWKSGQWKEFRMMRSKDG